MASTWYCHVAGHEHGPYSEEQLLVFAREGRLSPLDFVREGTGAWEPASRLSWLSFVSAAPQALPGASPSAPPQPRESPAVWPWLLVGMAALAAVCVGGLVILVIVGVAGKGHDPAAGHPEPPHDVAQGVPLHAPSAIGRLRVSGRDATNELQSFVQSLSDEQRALLGLAALATGNDIYAAEVTISNTGTLPVRVSPQNVTVHYGSDAAKTSTSDHPRFLQACILQPGDYTQGLVMYEARMDIGAAMRLGGGTVAYNDPTIEVEYEQ